jgi:O-acetyl-ADP-ribose deacetylase (regulator of RNase III)
MKAIKADITTLKTDVIVNAANSSLSGGGGVDGAIHAAAGPALLAECKTLNGCKTGDAKITKGYNLPCRFVIHTVGPIWKKENGKEAELLASCYKKSCRLAIEHNLKTIAFPSVSTGVYGFPKEPAAKIAIATCAPFSGQLDITFCCFSEKDLKIYQQLLNS